jgi:transcription elongation factor Elf1
MICNSCHTENEEYRLFCAHCGKALASIRHVCSFINNEKDLYCGGCGQPLKVNQDVKAEKIDELSVEKFSDDDIEEIIKEENLHSKPKTVVMSQGEIDKLFKKS